MRKFLPYILILIILTGLFSSVSHVSAQACWRSGIIITLPQFDENQTRCESIGYGGKWQAPGAPLPPPPQGPPKANGPERRIPVFPPTPNVPPIPIKDASYNLLAPIDFGSDGISKFDPTEPDALGKYLNLMIKIIIGLSAVMSVVMIVIGGIEYMTSELVSSKEAGKERIRGALLGLLIALGAYALLYTINPDLLELNLKITPVTVQVTLDEAIRSDAGKTLPTGPISGCASGIRKTTSGMFACGDGNLVQNINDMISAAASNGINLTGGGYRSLDEQKARRIANCNGDFTNANAPCRPPTALPGQSNHNNGKAFDLQCDGDLIQTSDNKCFIWLKNNASRYGLSNLPSETWHWSVDGR